MMLDLSGSYELNLYCLSGYLKINQFKMNAEIDVYKTPWQETKEIFLMH